MSVGQGKLGSTSLLKLKNCKNYVNAHTHKSLQRSVADILEDVSLTLAYTVKKCRKIGHAWRSWPVFPPLRMMFLFCQITSQTSWDLNQGGGENFIRSRAITQKTTTCSKKRLSALSNRATCLNMYEVSLPSHWATPNRKGEMPLEATNQRRARNQAKR